MRATSAAPTASQQAAAEQLLADPSRWTSARRKADGRQFWIVAGRTGTYYTSADASTCRGFRERGICSHSLAAAMREAREAARLNPPELPVVTSYGPTRDRYSALFPVEA